MENKLILGDAIKELRKLKQKSINLVFADPPYNLSKSNFEIKFSKMNSKGKDMTTNKGEWDVFGSEQVFAEWCNEWIMELRRVLKDDGTVWISGTYHNIYTVGYLLKKNDFEVINEILWHKIDATPNLSCTRLVADHETIICARKKDKKHYFNYSKSKQYNNGKQLRSIWSSAKRLEQKRLHPTQKPEWILERIISIFSKRGGVVLDPFVGSGTTSVVAKRLGRKYVGIENDKGYFKIAQGRIKKEK